MKKSGTQTVQNSGPFRRTFGVGIRAANALPMSILTLAALLLALTLLSAGAPPASAQVDTAATEVEVFENWSLKPMGVVAVGGKFRLLIVTSTALNASTTLMDSYNGIIRDSVAAGHTDIRPYSHLFNALGSTAAVDAIVNTKTTHTTTDMGVPIYYLNGAKVADNYSDFYDGTWDSHDPTNELGTSSSAMAVWTGSQSNGMKHANPLGNRTSTTVRMGNPTSSVSGDVLSATLIRNHTFKDRGYPLPFYGLSPVFVVRALSAPDMPQDLTATQGVASVRLAWAAPKSDGGSPIIRYEYRHEAGTPVPSSTNWTPAGTAQSVTVTGLMGGTEYTFEVRAVNSIGNGQSATEPARTVVTENTLVSNLAQPDSGSFVKIRHRPDTLPDGYITGPKRLAQNFTTGANTSGYTLDGIDIRAAVRTLAHHSQDLDFDVSLCPFNDQNQSPGAGCSELTRPETFDARSRLNFQAPADLTLAANTTYAVVLSGYGDIATTVSDAEDTPATPGWSIDSYHTFIIWSTDEPNKGYWHSNRYSLAIPFAIRAVAMSGQQAADPPTITAPPSVSESGADGRWKPGQTVQATVTFSEAVAVDTSGGTPTITLTPGATGQKSASYTSGGGTEALVFAYTLSEDDGPHTSMGVAPDSLALNGGSITSEATGVNADLSHNGTLIMGTTEDTSTSDDGSAAKDDGSAAKDDGSAAKEDTEENEPAPNHPATGSPIIAGIQVGQTLAASTTGIADTDGLTNAAYSYQWIANDGSSDSDIADATASAYTLVARDAGKTIKVKVSFTDDGGNEETLTSAVTAAVAATVPGAPGSLSVSVNDTGKLDVSWSVPYSNGGSAVTGYRVQWRETPDSWDTPADVSETTVTGTNHTVAGLTDGVEYTFRVFAVNSAGDSPASEDESGTPRETSAPTVSSATVDGATLTLTFSEGLAETPLPAVATFTVNVEGNQRGVNTVAISGSTVTLTLASAVTSTDDVSVGYTVPSDAAAARLKDLSDNPAESFTGQAVTNSTAAAPPPLTASIHDEPSSHDGQKEFTFELRFSENPEGFSYKTMRDNAFTVTGGNVEGARRLDPPSNTKWQIKIRPTSNGDVTIVLPITEDCTADGAVCTGDRKLSNRLEIIVSGPNG